MITPLFCVLFLFGVFYDSSGRSQDRKPLSSLGACLDCVLSFMASLLISSKKISIY